MWKQFEINTVNLVHFLVLTSQLSQVSVHWIVFCGLDVPSNLQQTHYELLYLMCVVCGVFWFCCCVGVFVCGFRRFVKQHKAESVQSTAAPRESCSEFMRSWGGCPTLTPLQVKHPLLVCRVIWSECGLDVSVGHLGEACNTHGGKGVITIRKVNDT